jgi:hypothetical protein
MPAHLNRGAAVSDGTTGRGVVLAAAVMIITGQVLAIANDLVLRQSDPSDVVLVVVLIALAVFMARRARWARWATVVLVMAGGLLELAGVVLLIATKSAAGFWSTVDTAIPPLVSLHAAVVAFAAAPAFALLAGSVLISALLDLAAAGMLVFARSVRSYFSSDAGTSSA